MKVLRCFFAQRWADRQTKPTRRLQGIEQSIPFQLAGVPSVALDRYVERLGYLKEFIAVTFDSLKSLQMPISWRQEVISFAPLQARQSFTAALPP
jgi:hypothetical protein